MPDVLHTLHERFDHAVAAALGDPAGDNRIDPQLTVSTNPRFGDYQANLAMSLAKKVGQPPRKIAERIVAALDAGGVCERVEVAGPGFINLHLAGAFIDERLTGMLGDDRLGVPPVEDPQRIVVDYSGPNVAKEMHVGHLRSTVIGDSIARVLGFLGHEVVRQNHIGDWGTQFGMLIEHLIEEGIDTASGTRSLTQIYQAAKRRFDEDEGFAERARGRVVALQSGDERSAGYWRDLVAKSEREFQAIYGRLDVGLLPEHIRGESAYNDALPGVVESLRGAGLLRESQGAEVVYPEGFKNRDGEPMPMIVRKTDGGYLYATTDLAAARHRVDDLHAGRIIYVTDARQAQHFAMVFATLRQAGWAPASVRLDHVAFGTVLGKDNRPFKTRSGETVKLKDLLDEAEVRARAVLAEKNPDLSDDQAERIAHVIGIGALKYADLSSDRIKDYVFDWDRMLAFDGNTAPYLQNAYVRIWSIFRKGGVDTGSPFVADVRAAEPSERALGVKILQLPGVVSAVAESLEPHRLCTYLYELASAFHKFYETCPVLTAEDRAVRDSRLAVCGLVGRVLQGGLGMLGIEVVERM